MLIVGQIIAVHAGVWAIPQGNQYLFDVFVVGQYD